jgi:hypothetical protein
VRVLASAHAPRSDTYTITQNYKLLEKQRMRIVAVSKSCHWPSKLEIYPVAGEK